MKSIRLITVAVLTATILSGSITAFAEETREVITDGVIEFIPNVDEELIVIPPETFPEVEIIPEVPGTTGPLSIMKAATMNFGSQVISNQDQTYNMVAEMAELADGSGQVPYVSFAQVQDVRGTNSGWDLRVSLTDFTSNTQNNVLTGARIDLVESYIQYGGINQNNSPEAHQDGLELHPNVGSVSVMSAETGTGAGVSSVVWGSQDKLNEQFETGGDSIITNDAIQLFVPGSTAKDATTYTSTLNWSLNLLPGDDA